MPCESQSRPFKRKRGIQNRRILACAIPGPAKRSLALTVPNQFLRFPSQTLYHVRLRRILTAHASKCPLRPVGRRHFRDQCHRLCINRSDQKSRRHISIRSSLEKTGSSEPSKRISSTPRKSLRRPSPLWRTHRAARSGPAVTSSGAPKRMRPNTSVSWRSLMPMKSATSSITAAVTPWIRQTRCPNMPSRLAIL